MLILASTSLLKAQNTGTIKGFVKDAKTGEPLIGTTVQSVGSFRNDVIIRGGAPNENVYYLDGIEIPNIKHFSTQGSAGASGLTQCLIQINLSFRVFHAQG